MTEGSTIAVALIEDNQLMREGIAALLGQFPDLELVASVSDADPAPLRQVQPQVILLDLGLEHVDSLRMAEQVIVDFPNAKVLVMDLLPIHEEILEYVRAGASGFITKDAPFEDLVTTIRCAARGEDVLPRDMNGTLFSQIARDAVAAGRPLPLESVRMTPLEREVIGLIVEGMSHKEIAERLHVATHSVQGHVRNIMEKLTLHSHLQIAAYAHGQENP